MERESTADSAVVMLQLVNEARTELSKLKDFDNSFEFHSDWEDLVDEIEKQFNSFRKRARKLRDKIRAAAEKTNVIVQPSPNTQIMPCERHSCCNCGNSACAMHGVNCSKFVERTA